MTTSSCKVTLGSRKAHGCQAKNADTKLRVHRRGTGMTGRNMW